MAPSWHVQPASQEDRAAVAALWRSTGLGSVDDVEWRALVAGPCARLFIAREGHSVVGTAVAAFDGWRAYVYHVAVTPARTGEGIAQALMAHAEDELRGQGARRVYVLVDQANTAGYALCCAAGYEPEGDVALVKQLLVAELAR